MHAPDSKPIENYNARQGWAGLLVFILSVHCWAVTFGVSAFPPDKLSFTEAAILLAAAGCGPSLTLLAFTIWGVKLSLRLLIGTVLASAVLTGLIASRMHV